MITGVIVLMKALMNRERLLVRWESFFAGTLKTWIFTFLHTKSMTAFAIAAMAQTNIWTNSGRSVKTLAAKL